MTGKAQIKWSQLKVGLVVIFAVVSAMIGLLNLGGAGLFVEHMEYRTMVDRVNGLKVGAPVRLAGLDIGNVSKIVFSKDPRSNMVEITMDVRKAYAPRIKKDAVATIETIGLLGDKYLELSLGDPASPSAAPGGVIKGSSEEEVTRVIGSASAALESMNRTLLRTQQILKDIDQGKGTMGKLVSRPELYDDLLSSVRKLDALVSQVSRGEGSLGKLVRDPSLYNQLHDMAETSRAIVARILNGEGTAGKLVADPRLYDDTERLVVRMDAFFKSLDEGNGTLARLSKDPELYERLIGVATRFDSVLGRIEKGEGTAGKLVSDEQVYERLDQFLIHADELMVDMKKNPKRYFKVSVF